MRSPSAAPRPQKRTPLGTHAPSPMSEPLVRHIPNTNPAPLASTAPRARRRAEADASPGPRRPSRTRQRAPARTRRPARSRTGRYEADQQILVEIDRVVARRRHIATVGHDQPRPRPEEMFAAHRREGRLDARVIDPAVRQHMLGIGGRTIASSSCSVVSRNRPVCGATSLGVGVIMVSFFAQCARRGETRTRPKF